MNEERGMRDEGGIDWAQAEGLAFGSLLIETGPWRGSI